MRLFSMARRFLVEAGQEEPALDVDFGLDWHINVWLDRAVYAGAEDGDDQCEAHLFVLH